MAYANDGRRRITNSLRWWVLLVLVGTTPSPASGFVVLFSATSRPGFQVAFSKIAAPHTQRSVSRWIPQTQVSLRSSSKNNNNNNRTKIKKNRNRDVDEEATPRYPWGKFLHSLIFRFGAWLTVYIMKIRNQTHLHDEHHNLPTFVLEREDGQSLLTYSNHCSVWDDPGIWAGALPTERLNLDNWRSTLMDQDAYYVSDSWTADFYRGANCLPVRRADPRGIRGPSLRALHHRLVECHEWCHVMAEGRILQPWRFQHDETLPRLGNLRLGTAKLVCSSPPKSTVVLPIYHDGMHQLAPETPPDEDYQDDAKSVKTFQSPRRDNRSGSTANWFPTAGNRVDVYVGEPLDFSDLVPAGGIPFEEEAPRQVLRSINERLRKALLQLEQRATEGRLERKQRGFAVMK